MPQGGQLIFVGLGPGRWEDLTLDARDCLESASRVIVRTTRHPTVEVLRQRRPELVIESFDDLYETTDSFAELYPTMARRLVERASESETPVVYATPGHPLMGEESVRIALQEARSAGLDTRVVAGLSFLEPVCAALDLNPLERDLQLIDATLLGATTGEAVMGAVLPTKPALIAQVYNRRLASAVKLALSEVYPEDWEVTLAQWASIPGRERVVRLPLYALDRDEAADHLTTVYVPPLEPLAATRSPEGLRYVVQRLRAPDGCPWDREQTHQSLRRYALEEAYEVAEAIDELDGSPERAEHLAEELGDLLLQVYLQAEVANQEDLFHLGDVYQLITEKLIRRHPHVFGEVEVSDAQHVVRNWEAIKRQERADRGEAIERESVLHGVPRSAPALYQTYELTRKASKAGFRFATPAAALAKAREEAGELAAEVARLHPDGEQPEMEPEERETLEQAVRLELGDTLFALAVYAQSLGLRPEDALVEANARFRRRFERMETLAADRGLMLADLDEAAWQALWTEAKAQKPSAE